MNSLYSLGDPSRALLQGFKQEKNNYSQEGQTETPYLASIIHLIYL